VATIPESYFQLTIAVQDIATATCCTPSDSICVEAMAKDEYRKHFIPLESNPEVFTKLIHELGVSDNFSFVDIWALDCIEHVPRPAAALVLVLPTSTEYEQRKSVEDTEREEDNKARGDGVIWLPQTINNACGLYAILHAACNGDARLSIRRPIPNSEPCNNPYSKADIHKARDLSWPDSLLLSKLSNQETARGSWKILQSLNRYTTRPRYREIVLCPRMLKRKLTSTMSVL
jgi:hypothetical protein